MPTLTWGVGKHADAPQGALVLPSEIAGYVVWGTAAPNGSTAQAETKPVLADKAEPVPKPA